MRKEFQIKVASAIDLSLLLSIGGEQLGQVIQKDTYLASEDGRTWRVREENGQYLFAEKGHDIGQRARVKEVSEKLIDKTESGRLMRTYAVRAVVCKSRTLFRYNESVIALDEVEHLGEFVEIRSSDEQNLFHVLDILGLREGEATTTSYLDMMLAKELPAWLQSLIRFHDRVGELIFGITSGVLTTVGLLVGMNAATESRLAVVAGILVIAMADSLSDSFGMYLSKLGERGRTPAAAMRYAFGTFAGKLIFPLTFVVPLLLPVFSLSTAVAVDLGWGAVALSLLSAEHALVSQESIFRTVGRNLGLAILIVCLSMLIGAIVPKIISL